MSVAAEVQRRLIGPHILDLVADEQVGVELRVLERIEGVDHDPLAFVLTARAAHADVRRRLQQRGVDAGRTDGRGVGDEMDAGARQQQSVDREESRLAGTRRQRQPPEKPLERQRQGFLLERPELEAGESVKVTPLRFVDRRIGVLPDVGDLDLVTATLELVTDAGSEPGREHDPLLVVVLEVLGAVGDGRKFAAVNVTIGGREGEGVFDDRAFSAIPRQDC